MRVVQLSILSQIRSGRVRHVHLGTPCSVWSLARRGIRDWAKARQKEIFGVEFALFSAEVAAECSRCGIGFSIENPRGSRLWQFPPVAAAQALPGVRMIELHMCSFGARRKKPTYICTDVPELDELSVLCSGVHTHETLAGSKKVMIGKKMVLRSATSRAGE